MQSSNLAKSISMPHRHYRNKINLKQTNKQVWALFLSKRSQALLPGSHMSSSQDTHEEGQVHRPKKVETLFPLCHQEKVLT